MSVGQHVESAPANFRRGARPTWHQHRRHDMVRRLTAGLAGSALDYGCGWGDITHLLAPQFDSILGVDVSKDRVSHAAKEYAPIRFEVCPGGELPSPGQSFDTVLSIMVLPFVPDPDRYLSECARVLRPGGCLVLATVNPDSNHGIMRRLVRRSASSPSVRRTFPALTDRLARIGFEREAIDGFFDPPFDRITNLGEGVLAALNVIGHLRRDLPRSTYLAGRFRKVRQA